ncbi:MAG: hypothetical protein JW864_09220 [Spirochaetes bacterium]|nr:hypothetical protein [Spirochaetota bacterium]
MLRKKSADKKKEKPDKNYFIVLMKKSNLLFASWKIDNSKWKGRIEIAEAEPSGKHYLYINILAVENGGYKIIDSIPVHGLENQWHIFMKKDYFGKRVMLRLVYKNTKEKSFDILNSPEIDIPFPAENFQESQTDNEKALYELSGINLAGKPDSAGTSSW